MMSQQQEHPSITIVDGEFKHQTWALTGSEMVLGRDNSADIVVPMRQVSRKHVLFRREDDNRVSVLDLESRNGTWVNGNRVNDLVELSDGDEINLALKLRIRYSDSGITAPVTQNLPEVIPSTSGRGSMTIDTEARRVSMSGVEMDPPLSLPQYRLLELLYVNQGRVCSREEVVEAVWPDAVGEGVSEQAIDALVRRLRDRLTELDDGTRYVVTVRGHGFRLDNPPAP